MADLGLFPLGLVLLPTERVPLHIFEPRYRELIAECVAEDREFGIVLGDDGGLRQVGTRAAVVEVLEELPDGRSNVLVEGRERFRVVRLTSGRSFATAAVEPFRDVPGEPDPDAAARALEGLERLAELTDSEVEPPDPGSPELSFEIAGRVELEAPVKQELLESVSEAERLARVAALLHEAAEAVRAVRELSELASRNGKGRHHDGGLPGA